MQRLYLPTVYVALALAVLLAVPGPVFGFGIPRVVAITATSLLLAGSVTLVLDRWARYDRMVQALMIASGAFAVVVLLLSVLGASPRLSLLGQDSRFVGGLVLALPFVLVFALPAVLVERRSLDRVLNALIGVLAVAVAYALLQYAGLDPMPWGPDRGGRPVSFFGNSNFTGSVLCLAIPAAWWLWTRGAWWRLAAPLLAVGAVVAIDASQARVGLVAAVGGVMAIGLVLVRLPWRQVQSWLIAALPVSGVVVGLGIVAAAARFGDGNAIARVSFWRVAGRMWRDRPLVGQGVGRFEPAFRSARGPEEVTGRGSTSVDLVVDSTHAFVMDLLATTGLVATLLWIAVLVLAGLVLRQIYLNSMDDGAQRQRVALIAGLLTAHALQSSISVPIVTTVWLGWFFLGLLLSIRVAVDPEPRRRRSRGRNQTTGVDAAGVVAVVLALVSLVPGTRLVLASDDVAQSQGARGEGMLPLAVERSAAATQRAPWWPDAWVEFAVAIAQSGDPVGARDAALRALEADPVNRAALGVLVSTEEFLQGPDALEPIYLRMLELDPYGVGLNLAVLSWAQDTGRDELAEQARASIEASIGPGDRQWSRFERILEDA